MGSAATNTERCADCGEPFTTGVCQTMECGYQWRRVVADPPAATNTDRATLYRSPSTWIDRGAFNERRKAARESLSLALDSLATAGGTDDATEAADELAAAQAHLDAARDEIEAAFRGIDS